jgi:predicted alpha/beta superfamily hydrolase
MNRLPAGSGHCCARLPSRRAETKELPMSHPDVRASDQVFEDRGPATLGRTHSFNLQARAVDQVFQIDVALPVHLPVDGERLPVVYVLDGNAAFGLVAQAARLLQTGPHPLPATLIVGIGYAGEDAQRALHLRWRDLMPSVDEGALAMYRTARPPWRLPDDIQPGRADDFLAFIDQELKPFLAERFPVDPEDQTIVGVSAGGVFALHALFTSPASFQRYVAVSPAIYWDNRILLIEEAAYAAKAKDLPAHLFLGVGGLEEIHHLPSRMVSNLYEFEAILRQRRYPSLQMRFHVFPDETHLSVPPGGVTRGLTEVFGGHRQIAEWARSLQN